MSKDKVKKAKGELTYEQATENYESAKAARQKARKAVEKLATEKGLNGKADHSNHKDKTFVKEYKPLREAWLAAKEAEAEAESVMKGLKPQSARKTSYEYPADVVTAEDKKKFRAKARAAAKKGEKAADKPEKSGKSSKEEKSSGKKDKIA
jgi:hypothetical protein